MENSLRAKGCCRAGALPRSCGVLIGVAGMWNREKCARNSNIVHASFAPPVCLAGLPSHVQVAKEACGAADPAGTHLAASEPVQQLFVRSMADLHGGNSTMLLAGRMGRQHVNAAEWLSERPSDYLLPAFHISAFCSFTSHASSASAKALCSGKLCSLLEEAC